MSSIESNPAATTPAWSVIRAAISRGDQRQADLLFLRQFRNDRRDAMAQAEYGLFCLQSGRPAIARYLLHRAHALDPDRADARCHLGYAYLELRQFDRARDHFEATLDRWPDHAQALQGLGLCMLERENFAAAAATFDKAVQATPTAVALPLLVRAAEASHRGGNDERARELFAQASRLAGDHPALLLAHARFLRESGEHAAAMARIDQCLRQDPREPRLLLEKVRCLRQLGQVPQALPWLDRLGQVAPTMPEIAEESGNCLLVMGQPRRAHEQWTKAIEGWIQAGEMAQAEALLERLLRDDPRNAGGWNARGTLESTRQNYPAAEEAWRQAIDCDRGLIAASANLAAHLENTNRLDAARAVAEPAVDGIKPGDQQASSAGLLLALARVERRQHAPERGLALLERADANGPTDIQRAAAHLERGKILQTLGRTADAMAAFVAGNAAAAREWRRMHPEDNTVVAGIDQVLGLSATGWWSQLRPIADVPDHPPIAFLLGFPRSGTTLLNQVLDGHPAICAMDELPVIARLVEASGSIPGGYPHALAELDAIDVQWLREIYLDQARRLAHPHPGQLLLDKFPTSTILAGMLHRVFPQARFVFALRHPCDVLLSCFMQGFQLSETMVNFCTLADTVALYTRTMDLWKLLCEQLPLQVHVVRYEDVVDDFDGQVSALCRFLGVAWHEALRDFPGKAMARAKINTPSYEQVVRPIYREALHRWEGYREYLEPFLPTLQPYIERFGYADPAPPAG